MNTLLVITFCTIFSPDTKLSPFCYPMKLSHPTVALCQAKADYFNTKFDIKRVYKGDVASNEVAMTKPAECTVPPVALR